MINKKSKSKNINGKDSQKISYPNFLKKTYEIVDNPRFNDLIDWTSNGEAFVIKKPKEFTQKILPAFFKHNNFSSFTRQKTKSEFYDHIYHHPHFRRGFKDELMFITRKVSEGVVVLDKNKITSESAAPNDTESLIQENYILKKLHLEANQKIRSLEIESRKLCTDNQQIYKNIQEQSQIEDYLVKIIDAIGVVYGFSSIDNVMKLSKEKLPDYTTSRSYSSTLKSFIQDFLADKTSPSVDQARTTGGKGLFFSAREPSPLDLPLAVHGFNNMHGFNNVHGFNNMHGFDNVHAGNLKAFFMNEPNRNHFDVHSFNTALRGEITKIN